MKVLLLHPHITSFGGGEKLLLDYYNYLSKNHEVIILTNSYEPEKTFEGFSKISKLYEFNIRGKINVLKKWINLDASNYDIAIACGFPCYWASWKNKNIIYKVMAPPSFTSGKNIFLKSLDKFFLKRCKLLIFDSNNMENYYRHYRSEFNIDYCTITPGVNEWKSIPNKTLTYAVHVSRLSPEKGLEKLINVWPKEMDYKLVIVGGGVRSYEEKLKLLASRKNIEFVGQKSYKETQEIIRKSNMLLLAAPAEPFGLVVLEALSNSKPVIALDSGGPSDIIINHFDGYLCQDYNEIIRRVLELIKDNKKLQKMSKNALETSRKYDQKTYLLNFENIIV